MITKFEKEITNLTEGTITMGIEEFLLDQAKKEGMTEKDIAFTKNLLTSTDFSVLKIVQLVGVSEDFVLKVKNSLNK